MKGVCVGANFFGFALLQPARSVSVSSKRFFSLTMRRPKLDNQDCGKPKSCAFKNILVDLVSPGFSATGDGGFDNAIQAITSLFVVICKIGKKPRTETDSVRSQTV